MSTSGTDPRRDLPEGLNLPVINDASPAVDGRRRAGAASVTLRQRSDAADDAASFDPATKSLADALRITYRLLQFSMVILVGLYLLSGFQSVKESERGIRLSLGRVVARDLPPGFQFSMPAPFGELVKVPTGLQTQEIDKPFFPRLTEAEEKTLVDKDKGVSSLVGGADSLDPDADGHLITADGNIAHARWSVTYQRLDAGMNAANIDPEFERQIVTAAAARGIVRAAASLPIDDLLKKQIDTSAAQAGSSMVETLARNAAQQALNDMDSGIQLVQLTMTLVIPPRNVMDAFQGVQAAQSTAGKAIDEARTARNDILTRAAGEAAGDLLRLIDRYELAIGRKEPEVADATLNTIERLFQKEAVQIEGVAARPLSGRVSQVIDDARQFRSSVVNQAKESVEIFNAKKALFESNPTVMVTGDWTRALSSFVGRTSVQSIFLPPGLERNVLLINRDPQVTRRITQAQLLEENKKAEQERIRERERARFQERMDNLNRSTTE